MSFIEVQPFSFYIRSMNSLLLHIAVASNFLAPLTEITKVFTQKTGIPTTISAGASGKLFAQIENGAPFDIFMSAEQDLPKKLVDKKLAEGASEFTYAAGTLVIWSTDTKIVDSKGAVLKEMKFRKIAIANPELAPYGKAAQQALQKLGIWNAIQPKIVMGENIAQTHQFILTGNAELGFIAGSQYLDKKSGSAWNVPADLHAPILQDAVLLKHGNANPAAKKFLEFLKGKESKEIIQRFGYTFTHG